MTTRRNARYPSSVLLVHREAAERVEVPALWHGVVWRGVPPFTHEQAPPRARRRQVHLVRV